MSYTRHSLLKIRSGNADTKNNFSKKRTLKMLKIRAYLLVNVPDLELYKAVVDSIDVASVVAERHSSCPFGVL